MTVRIETTRTERLAEIAESLSLPAQVVVDMLDDVGFVVGENGFVPRWAADRLRTMVEMGLEPMGARERRWRRTSLVYFVRRGDAIKIGVAGDVRQRINGLQTANNEDLELLGSMSGGLKLERTLHKRFARIRIRGEWFRATPALLRYIDENAAGAAA